MTVTPEEKDKLEKLAMLYGIPGAALVQDPNRGIPQVPAPGVDPLPEVSPNVVNMVLKQKGLPPLSGEEQKLLQAVNSRIEQVKAELGDTPQLTPEQAALLAGTPAAAADPKAALPKDALSPQLQHELAARGIDPRKVKSAETSASQVGAAPEKILSTEAYLQMQGMNKAMAKDAGGNQQVDGAAGPVPSTQSASEALTAGAVAATDQKGQSLAQKEQGANGQLPEGAKQAKLDAAAGGAFAAGLVSQSRQDGAIPTREVNLAGGNAADVRNALLAEVSTNVALHAHKGGGEMKLVINPQEMGEVKLKVGTKDGKVEVQMIAQNDDVAKMLRGGSKELESSLRNQNLSLAKFEVSVGDAVAATDVKTGLNEQMFSQNQHQHSGGFWQGASSDDGRSARWGGEQAGRQGQSYRQAVEDLGRSMPSSALFAPKQMARDSSRRLDVVA